MSVFRAVQKPVCVCVCLCFLTYEGAPFGAEFRRHADTGAQVQHDQHGNDHDDALQQQQGVEVTTESVGDRKNVSIN